ncbi:hypothetical protein TRFO_26230 [Tritrichomonas foetus]|uniref:Trafficking protein particle complex subunit 11 C-terminal domain-containing protein n=1 Tax=Tritrichomonas foetus TaxID=1144522 RepID=A0A1J4K840_9EUKA|nr:hypothetical protein TRFO_26230 [Tritrichomonas foetus]|eukprot:OHT05876.1 hypothetical protein TRFO_26230 [Tritrichomonas foetus]
MKRDHIDESILSGMKFELVVPLDPLHCFDDIENCERRTWGVPGEVLHFFILTSASILQLDSLSFNVLVSRQRSMSRRTTLIYAPNFEINDNFIDSCETKTNHRFPTNEPFRLPDGRAVYPLTVKIPITMSATFSLEVFLPRKVQPIAKVELRSIQPFTVTFEQFSTAVSSIAKFNITTSLKSDVVKEIQLQSADVEFDTHPPNHEEDYLSHIRICKPSPFNCASHDDDNMSVIFSFIPLSEKGAVMLTNLTLHFMITWRVMNLEFTIIWEAKMENSSLGLAMLLPPITAKVNQTTTIPLRITNLKSPKKENLEIVFEGGPIQPVAERVKVPDLDVGSSATVNISLLPLSIGYHKFTFRAEDATSKIYPLFPTYISVVE